MTGLITPRKGYYQVNAFDFMTRAQIADVQARGWALDVTDALQAAVDRAAFLRAELRLPGGLYKITPRVNPAFEDEDTSYVTLAAILLRSNLSIQSDPGAEIRIADGVSTDAAPKSMGMFCTSEVLHDVAIRGLVMDMNGQNNPISPLRPATYNRYNQSMILVSGTVAGVAARIDNVIIEDNVFRNNPGVSCLCAAQSNAPGVTLGKNWKIKGNFFLENGYDSDDHSAVFAWVDDVECTGNVFHNSKNYHEFGKTGGNTCYEIHGSRQKLIGNTFSGYYRGVWVAPNMTSAYVDDCQIIGNFFTCNFYGVDFFRTAASQSAARNTLVEGNTFRFGSYTMAGAPQQRACVQVASAYAISGVLVAGNIAHSTDTQVGATFVTIATLNNAGQEHDQIVIRGNSARGFVTGVNIRTSATCGLGLVEVSGNTWSNPIANGTFATPIGVFVDPVAAVKTLLVTGNKTVDNSASPPLQYGVYIQPGTVTDLYCSDNAGVGMGGGRVYYQAGVVAGRKHGYYEALDFTPVLRAGGVAVTVGNAVLKASRTLCDKEVRVHLSFKVGATTGFPAGALSLDLLERAADLGVVYIGSWRVYDVSTGQFRSGQAVVGADTQQVAFQTADASVSVTGAVPVVLADGDELTLQITYVRA